MRRPGLLRLLLGMGLVASNPAAMPAQTGGPLIVYNAGSLGRPFRDVLKAFVADHPGVGPAQENSGSLEAARKLTELGKIPDILGVADYAVIPKLLIPKFASWYATFAKNSMVLVYTDESTAAREITPRNWYQILLRPGIRTGRADPALDPNGYRTLMVFQLAERQYGQPGLAAKLLQATPDRYVRPKEADLTALVQAGELDYSFSYLSIAKATGLKYVELPPEVGLGDPSLGEWYSQARVKLPGASRAGADSVEFRGEPIVYAFTIPTGAPHREVAEAFARFLLSGRGRAILEQAGLVPLARPLFGGPGQPPASVRDASSAPN